MCRLCNTVITRFWPYSIDILQREKGAVEGTKPVFFIGWEEDTLRYEQFLFGDRCVESLGCILVIDIGVQVETPLNSAPNNVCFIVFLWHSLFTDHPAGILVRDDNARDRLRKQVGEIGLILFVPSALFGCVHLLITESKDIIREQRSRVRRRKFH